MAESRCCIVFWLRTAFLLLLVSGANAPAQRLDVNSNGASDVWEVMYDAELLAPNEDTDRDGVPNNLEAVAGTNPFESRSVPRIAPFSLTPTIVRASMSGALGKRYELQMTEALCGPDGTNWFTIAELVTRTNPMATLSAPIAAGNQFFRMVISDLDSDSDGLSDWEEYQLGLDPFSSSSVATDSSLGSTIGDYARALQLLKLAPVAPAPSSSVKTSLAVYPSAAAAGSGLTASYFTNFNAVYTHYANFNPSNLFLTRIDPEIDFVWGPGDSPNLRGMPCTVRWEGQVEPRFSETYVFQAYTDDGVKLWVNDVLLIDKWRSPGTTAWTGEIFLRAGVRYNIRMEYFNGAGHALAQLFWYSHSQTREIIPSTSLFPLDQVAPGGITSPLEALAFVGQPFTYTVTAANSPFAVNASNLPAGLSFDPATGTITGAPAIAGDFAIELTATNAIGVANAILKLHVVNNSGFVGREIWTGVPGTLISQIPLDQPPSISNVLTSLEGSGFPGDNYAERVRGYFMAPETGNYYFWITADGSAELWISNDDDPVNCIRRAGIYNAKKASPRQYQVDPRQRSPWLALEGGKRYYFEILHKSGKGAKDQWSVGWRMDPEGTSSFPVQIVPGYVLSPYSPTTSGPVEGTLFSANMLVQNGAISSGSGSATLRLSDDQRTARLRFSYSGLSSPKTASHIHADTYLGKNAQGQIIFDIDTAEQDAEGNYLWNIAASGPLSAADIVEIIKEGKAYLNVHTVNYPAGEINGHFALATGARAFSPPRPPPTWVDDHANSNGAARFLTQATFGPSPSEIASVQKLGYSKWIDRQFRLSPTSHLKLVLAAGETEPDAFYSGNTTFNAWWQNSVTAPDQLRQRVAFALSEILVVSELGPLRGNSRALSAYYDVLLEHAFGNFRELLEAVTLSPAMGLYLDMRRNEKANPLLNSRPNENYAREILQLFTVGLNRMWPDGTLVLNSRGELVPTYDQDVIMGFARVFTGWNYHQPMQGNRRLPNNWNPKPDYINPMVLVPARHEPGMKHLLNNVVLPGAYGAQLDPNNAAFDAYGQEDLERALDVIFEHDNVAPFICRQLIQRLVTSHPSRDYLYRVVQKFNDNGSGVRGDMRAVIKAILLDYEARSSTAMALPTFGKQREPVLRATAVARAFPAPPPLKAKFRQNGTEQFTITTTKPHRISAGDDVFIEFAGKSVPASGVFKNVSPESEFEFTVSAPEISHATYRQSGTSITIDHVESKLIPGDSVYLQFSTGGVRSGVFKVVATNSSGFTVTAADSAVRSGNCCYSQWSGGRFVQVDNNVIITTPGAHGLRVGDEVFIRLPRLQPQNGVYRIAKVPSKTQFSIIVESSEETTGGDVLVLPQKAPQLVRSGKATLHYSTWKMNGTGGHLAQTPLSSPTVFNFFLPDYRFPGMLAAAGLTTPEFQLTSDTTVIQQMNHMASGVFNPGANTNGLSSFNGGNGAIVLDLSPWMTPAWTSDTNIPRLVDALNCLLCSGNLSPAARNIIIAYVASNSRFPYTTPTNTQMRNRVRAVVHLIATSPDFAIQR